MRSRLWPCAGAYLGGLGAPRGGVPSRKLLTRIRGRLPAQVLAVADGVSSGPCGAAGGGDVFASIHERALGNEIKRGAFFNRTYRIECRDAKDGTTTLHKVVPSGVDYDPVSNKPIAVTFYRYDECVLARLPAFRPAYVRAASAHRSNRGHVGQSRNENARPTTDQSLGHEKATLRDWNRQIPPTAYHTVRRSLSYAVYASVCSLWRRFSAQHTECWAQLRVVLTLLSFPSAPSSEIICCQLVGYSHH